MKYGHLEHCYAVWQELGKERIQMQNQNVRAGRDLSSSHFRRGNLSHTQVLKSTGLWVPDAGQSPSNVRQASQSGGYALGSREETNLLVQCGSRPWLPGLHPPRLLFLHLSAHF